MKAHGSLQRIVNQPLKKPPGEMVSVLSYYSSAFKILCMLILFKLHCVKSVRIRSYSGPHFPLVFPHSHWIRRDTEYLSVFSPNAGKCEKNADQNNPEYGNFLHSVADLKKITGDTKNWIALLGFHEDFFTCTSLWVLLLSNRSGHWWCFTK